jgi:hypothetical protein
MVTRTFGVNKSDGLDINDFTNVDGFFPSGGVVQEILPSGQKMAARPTSEIRIDGVPTQQFSELPSGDNFSMSEGLSLRTSGVKSSAPEVKAVPDDALTPEADQLAKNRQMTSALGVADGIGGVLNANAKYNALESQTRFNVQMARNQAAQVRGAIAQKVLQEKEAGRSRAGDAQLAAVAQGQSAGGDMAQTAMSNEEVFAAQQAMITEINGMRQIFGIESQIRAEQSSLRQAKIQRDLDRGLAIGKAGISVLGGMQ